MTDSISLIALAESAADWTCLLPAILAVGLSMLLRSVLPALFLAVWCGLFLLEPAGAGFGQRLGESFLITVTEALPQQIAPSDGDTGHVEILLFTLFLGCMIGVMQTSGGTAALVERLTPLTSSRRGGQVTTWLLGMVIFFDDYANSLLVGSTMRPVTDRLRISREKLAFLVDATAAPISGLAIVSTWVGFEVTQIADSFTRLAAEHPDVAMATDGYSTLLATLPYRSYPLLIILFVGFIAWTGRDFASMRSAERRALQGRSNSLDEGESMSAGEDPKESAGHSASDRASIPDAQAIRDGSAVGSMWTALIPLLVLFTALVLGLWWTGMQNVEAQNPSVWEIVSASESNKVMLASSFAASLTAVLMSVLTRSLSFLKAIDAWLDGAKHMLIGCAVLVLAWAIAMVCDPQHLGTADYLVAVTEDWLLPMWLPTVTFLLSGVIAFATGSSWATMGLVIPLVIEVTFQLLVGEGALSDGTPLDRHPLMLASIGGVLAGAIFGDHCSPISDTTVLSSIAADCDHIAHVTTQMPYAISVATIAIACGTLPAGFGLPWLVTLPVGAVACWLLVRYVGRPLECEST